MKRATVCPLGKAAALIRRLCRWILFKWGPRKAIGFEGGGEAYGYIRSVIRVLHDDHISDCSFVQKEMTAQRPT